MPIAKVRLPDGRVGRFNVPDGTTPEEVLSFAESNLLGKKEQTRLDTVPSHATTMYPVTSREAQAATETPDPVVLEKETDNGFVGNVTEDIKKRVGNVKEYIDVTTGGEPVKKIARTPGILGVSAGQTALGVGDVLGEGITSGYKTFVPKEKQEKIAGFVKDVAGTVLDTPIGKAGLQLLEKSQKGYEAFRNNNPAVALEIESVLGLSGLGVGGKTTSLVGKEAANIARDISLLGKKVVPGAINSNIKKEVTEGFLKGVRPYFSGKASQVQSNKYFDSATTAIETIIENKKDLKLTNEFMEEITGQTPKTINQLKEAVHYNKADLFKQYDELASATKDVVSTQKPVGVLREFVKNKPLSDLSPETMKYAEKQAVVLARRGSYTASEAQEFVKILNSSLESFYKNPTIDTASRAAVDAVVASSMRKELDNVIGKATGGEYQIIKNKYGAFKEIEKDINRRSITLGRQNDVGLIDLSDLHSVPQAISAILKLDPKLLATAATTKLLAQRFKFLNNPNTRIEKMFNKVEKLMEVKDKFIAKSTTGKMANNAYQNTVDNYKKLQELKSQKLSNPLKDGSSPKPNFKRPPPSNLL